VSRLCARRVDPALPNLIHRLRARHAHGVVKNDRSIGLAAKRAAIYAILNRHGAPLNVLRFAWLRDLGRDQLCLPGRASSPPGGPRRASSGIIHRLTNVGYIKWQPRPLPPSTAKNETGENLEKFCNLLILHNLDKFSARLELFVWQCAPLPVGVRTPSLPASAAIAVAACPKISRPLSMMPAGSTARPCLRPSTVTTTRFAAVKKKLSEPTRYGFRVCFATRGSGVRDSPGPPDFPMPADPQPAFIGKRKRLSGRPHAEAALIAELHPNLPPRRKKVSTTWTLALRR